MIAAVGGATALGALLAAITTPLSVQHLGRRATLVTALSAGAVVELSVLTYCRSSMSRPSCWAGRADRQIMRRCRDAVRRPRLGARSGVLRPGRHLQRGLRLRHHRRRDDCSDDGHTAVLPVIGSVLYLLGIVAVRVLHPAATPLIRSQLSATGG